MLYRVNNPEDLKKEIMLYGPVQAGLIVFDSFYKYKTGIFRRQESDEEELGAHAVVIVGWGVQVCF